MSAFEGLLLAQTNFLLNPPVLAVADTGSGTTSLPAATPEFIKMATIDKDSFSGWDGNHTYTIQVAGVYEIFGGFCSGVAASSGYCLTEVYYNGSALNRSQLELTMPTNAAQGTWIQPFRTFHWPCNVGDTLAPVAQTAQAVSTQAASTFGLRWVHA